MRAHLSLLEAMSSQPRNGKCEFRKSDHKLRKMVDKFILGFDSREAVTQFPPRHDQGHRRISIRPHLSHQELVFGQTLALGLR